MVRTYLDGVTTNSGWTLPRVGWEVYVDAMKQAESGKAVELWRVNDTRSPQPKALVIRLRKSGDAFFSEFIVVKDLDLVKDLDVVRR